MNFENNIERIFFYISLLTDASDDLGGHDFIISEVAEKFDIPVGTIRNDLSLLIKQPFFRNICFKYYPDSTRKYKNNENLSIEDFIDHEGITFEEFDKKLNNGDYDDRCIFFGSTPWHGNSDHFRFPVSNAEKAVVGQMFSGSGELYIPKEMPCQLDQEMRKKISIINSAILNENDIRIDYFAANGKVYLQDTVSPEIIRIDSQNPGKAICVLDTGNLMRISRMKNIKEVKREPKKAAIKEKLVDDWDAIWGLPSDRTTIEGQTQHVIIRINANTGNILEKIRADVSRRVHAQIREVGDNIYIYEDEVSGFLDFKLWLWSYGASVKVLEPKWLAQQITDDYKTMREQYETGQWQDRL